MTPRESRYTLDELRGGPAVDEAYGVLDGWFGVRGELERRSVIDDWLSTPDGRVVDGIWMRYHLLAARTREGDIAAVRDCHVTLDAAAGVCVVYLAHAFVDPMHRRTGLAQRLRDVPLELARADMSERGVDRAEVLLALEQEFVSPDVPDTVIRLVAYGRAGFKAVAPEVLPYAQPDFSDLDATGLDARPLPLLAVVRRVGFESAETLPAALAEAYVRHLYAVFATHCRAGDLAPPRRRALDALRASGLADVPLLAMPRSIDDHAATAPLMASRAAASA